MTEPRDPLDLPELPGDWTLDPERLRLALGAAVELLDPQDAAMRAHWVAEGTVEAGCRVLGFAPVVPPGWPWLGPPGTPDGAHSGAEWVLVAWAGLPLVAIHRDAVRAA